MDADEGPRLDYEQTAQLARALVDVRVRLLALVPTVTGVAVAVIGRPRPARPPAPGRAVPPPPTGGLRAGG